MKRFSGLFTPNEKKRNILQPTQKATSASITTRFRFHSLAHVLVRGVFVRQSLGVSVRHVAHEDRT
jgi:hypothetical protein|tara:strand:+ start:1982 stop:2179 length:198 start_codon:yes stop_codon:yes gene_type:complete